MVGAQKGRLLARRYWPSESRVCEEELLRGRSDEVVVGSGQRPAEGDEKDKKPTGFMVVSWRRNGEWRGISYGLRWRLICGKDEEKMASRREAAAGLWFQREKEIVREVGKMSPTGGRRKWGERRGNSRV